MGETGEQSVPQEFSAPETTSPSPEPIIQTEQNDPALETVSPASQPETPQNQESKEHSNFLGRVFTRVKDRFHSKDHPVMQDPKSTESGKKISRRNFLKGAAGVALGAGVSAIDSNVAFASKPPSNKDIQPATNPNLSPERSVISSEEIVEQLLERVYNDEPGEPLSPEEEQEAYDRTIENIDKWYTETKNKKGLFFPKQIDENTIYPSYYLDNGGAVPGRNIGERQRDGTFVWKRDYRPINLRGLTLNLPRKRVPQELQEIIPLDTRTPDNWWEVVNQFGLDNPDNTRYQPDQYTYCNFAARDMLRTFGIGDIPQWYKDFTTGQLRETVTNIMYRQIKEYGTFNYEKYQQEGDEARDWINLDKAKAVEYAQKGIPIVLLVGRSTGVGHMALLAPTSTEEKLIVAQAGARTGIVEWDESYYSKENNYTDTMFLVNKIEDLDIG